MDERWVIEIVEREFSAAGEGGRVVENGVRGMYVVETAFVRKCCGLVLLTAILRLSRLVSG